MLQLSDNGKIVAWQTKDGNIITSSEERYAENPCGAQFCAPYIGRPQVSDESWEGVGIRPSTQNHFKNGNKILQKVSVVEVNRRQKYCFKFAGSRDFPWEYAATISIKEFPVSSDGSCGLSYDLTTARQENCQNKHKMPYRASLQTYFAIINKSFKFTVGDKVIAEGTKFALGSGSMVFHLLRSDRLETLELVTGHRTISISCMGVDQVMLWSDDEERVCIELLYGEKHDKSLALGEDHQLLCGLVVSHT